MLKRPTLQWRVAQNGSTVTRVWATLNGSDIPCSYDSTAFRVTSQPNTILIPGTYQIEMGVHTNDGINVKKNWTLQVSANAQQAIPVLTAEQKEVADAINRLRKGVGLQGAQMTGDLSAAAQGHADFLADNDYTGHYQKPNMRGFFGKDPMDRAQAYGHIDGCWEVVFSGKAGISQAVQSLFDAPYHRLPFLQSGPLTLGTGASKNRVVALFNQSMAQSVGMSPAPNQTGIPVSWNQNERPNPLRIHKGLQLPVGYPIVISDFTPDVQRIVVHSAHLLMGESETPVPFALNEPANDDALRSAAVLLPKSPLQPNTVYRVRVEYERENGIRVLRDWKFSTGSP